jgi:hypothetical protein
MSLNDAGLNARLQQGGGLLRNAVNGGAGAHRDPRNQRRRDPLISRRLSLTAALAVIASLSFVIGGTGAAQAVESYRLRCAEKTYSYNETTSPNGVAVRHHELRAGDIAALDAKYPDGRQRCEKIGQTDFPFRTPIWFSYSFRQTGSMPSTWVTMSQFHASPESGESAGKPPAFLMQQQAGRLQLVTRSDSRVNTTSQVEPVVRYAMPWFPAGTWQKIVVRLNFDHAGNGNITFWLNGVQKYSSGPIPMGYNDTVGPHFAHGQYRGASTLTTAFDFANVEVGRTSLLDRVTNPRPLPN